MTSPGIWSCLTPSIFLDLLMQLLKVLSAYNNYWMYTLEEEMVKALNVNLTNFIFSWENKLEMTT